MATGQLLGEGNIFWGKSCHCGNAKIQKASVTASAFGKMKILDLYFSSSNGCHENVIIAGKERRNVILDNAPFCRTKGGKHPMIKKQFSIALPKDFQVAGTDPPTKEILGRLFL